MEIFQVPDHSTTEHIKESWGRLRPGIRNSILYFHMDDRGKVLGLYSTVFPGSLAGRLVRSRVARIQIGALN